jgi:hypothetical protein
MASPQDAARPDAHKKRHVAPSLADVLKQVSGRAWLPTQAARELAGGAQARAESGAEGPLVVAHAVRDGVIRLSENEEKIFDTIIKVCQHFGLKTQVRCPRPWARCGGGCGACVLSGRARAQVRVAGGWVRDKILGKESHVRASCSFGAARRSGEACLSTGRAHTRAQDIDLALDDCMGQQFANHVNDYLVLTVRAARRAQRASRLGDGGVQGHHQSTIGVIRANPDQARALRARAAYQSGAKLLALPPVISAMPTLSPEPSADARACARAVEAPGDSGAQDPRADGGHNQPALGGLRR